MPKNDAQQKLLDTLFFAVYERLDEIGIPTTCPTRDHSWDEAACMCSATAEKFNEDKKLYIEAREIYNEASELWVNIENSRSLFNMAR